MPKTAIRLLSGLAQYCSATKGNRTITKLLLAMKLTIVLLTTMLTCAYAEGISQSVTYSGKEVSLQQVFTAIENQTGYVFFSNRGVLDNAKPVTISAQNMPLAEFLKTIMEDQPFEFIIEGKTIVLSPKSMRLSAVTSLPLPITLFVPTVSGRILSSDGQPISGATVSVRGSNKGTISEANGIFKLTVNTGDILDISSIGYITLSIRYEGSVFKVVPGERKQSLQNSSKLLNASVTSLSILLARSSSPLDEVQVTAYGKTSRMLATGNIGTVTAEEIERQPVMTALEALIGKVPGLEIRQNSGNAAAPVTVVIRGRNTINNNANVDPLYVIDGMPMSNLNSSPFTKTLNYQAGGVQVGAVQAGLTNMGGQNPLLGINPNDIESISVLKDANATAIYGARGANGVILITTKKGKQGPAQFSLSINNAVTFNEKYPRLMNTQEFLSVRREALLNDGLLLNNENAQDLLVWDTTKYTDWQRMLVGTGSNTSVNASVSGGIGQSNYRLSAGYSDRKELMNNGGKNKRGTFSGSFSHASPNQKFSFQLLNRLSLTDVTTYAINQMGYQPPNAPDIFDAKGEFNFELYRKPNQPDFPFADLKRPSNSNTFDLSNQFTVSYQILKGLTLSVNAGNMFTYNENSNLNPKASYDPTSVNPLSRAFFGKSISKTWQVEPQIGYLTYIGKGELSVQVIGNFQKAISSGETISSEDFINDRMMKSHNNAKTNTFTEGYEEYKYLSAITSLNYKWDNKYVIDLNARRDGSSRFGPGKQFGNFGSIGIAWIASNENWIKSILPSWFSLIKFRASTGIVGSDGIGAYEYLSRWSKSTATGGSQNIFRYNGTDGFHAVRPLNQDFQWESSRQQEFSTTLGFLKNRINLDFSYYSKYSDNQLTQLDIPSQTGFSKVLLNNPAGVENTGFELIVRASLLKTQDWAVDFSMFTSRNRNRLKKFPDIEKSLYKGKYRVGQSLNTKYLLHYTGIDPLTGSYTFEDRNKDGQIYVDGNAAPQTDRDDRYISINTDNQYNIGSSISFRYKSIAVATVFEFRKQLLADPYLNTVLGTMKNTFLRDDVKNNHWKSPGDQAKYPRYTTYNNGLGPIGGSDAFFIDGSYLRMLNLSVSWNLPEAWMKQIKMKGAAISLQTQNLFTLSNYPGIDPSIVGNANVATPVPRTINTQLSFNF